MVEQQQLSDKKNSKKNRGFFIIYHEFVKGKFSTYLGAGGIAVFVSLLHHKNSKSGLCCPSMKTIATETGIRSRQTVSKNLKLLIKFNIIQINKTPKNNGGYHNNYYINNPDDWSLPKHQLSKNEQCDKSDTIIKKKAKHCTKSDKTITQKLNINNKFLTRRLNNNKELLKIWDSLKNNDKFLIDGWAKQKLGFGYRFREDSERLKIMEEKKLEVLADLLKEGHLILNKQNIRYETVDVCKTEKIYKGNTHG